MTAPTIAAGLRRSRRHGVPEQADPAGLGRPRGQLVDPAALVLGERRDPSGSGHRTRTLGSMKRVREVDQQVDQTKTTAASRISAWSTG